MALLDELNPISGISKALFGDKGIAGGVIDTLQKAGIIKDPEAALKAQESLQLYDIKLKEIESEKQKIINDKLRIMNENIKSAREREIAVKDKTPSVLAYASFFGFFSILFILMKYEVPPTAHDVMMIMIGVLGGIIQGVISYYFGSSSGSAEKNKIIQDFVTKK